MSAVEVRELTTPQMPEASELLTEVWPPRPPIEPDLLQVLAHTGHYVAGAFAAGRLGDEGAGGVLGFDDARGMELDEFGIAQSRTSLDGQAEGVAGVLIPA